MSIVHVHKAAEQCNEKCMLVSGKTRTPVLAPFVARAFAQELYDELGEEIMREVIKRNRQEKGSNVCHSHDFCDANLTMLRAIQRSGVSASAGVESEAVRILWNSAWEMAVAEEFRSGRK